MEILEESEHLLFTDLSVHGCNVLGPAVSIGEKESTNALCYLLAELVALASEGLFLEMIHQIQQHQRVLPLLVLEQVILSINCFSEVLEGLLAVHVLSAVKRFLISDLLGNPHVLWVEPFEFSRDRAWLSLLCHLLALDEVEPLE